MCSSDLTLSFDTMSRAVEGRWNPPTAPADGQVTVLTARLPVDKPVGRYLRGMAWLSCQIPNNGAGFQDSDGLVGGRKHTYVAAVEVTVVVEYGVSIVEVADAIRRNIIEQIEGTTGLEVVEVNINVTDVHLPDDDSDVAEATDLK